MSKETLTDMKIKAQIAELQLLLPDILDSELLMKVERRIDFLQKLLGPDNNVAKSSMTYPLLANAPRHHDPKFIDYLRDHNTVVYEDAFWIIIENCKYHTIDRAHHTAFWKGTKPVRNIPLFNTRYKGWEVLIKPASKQSVKRFHMHFIEDKPV